MYVMHSADDTKDRWQASAWKTMYFIVAATDAASSKASAGVAPSLVPRGGVRTPQFAHSGERALHTAARRHLARTLVGERYRRHALAGVTSRAGFSLGRAAGEEQACFGSRDGLEVRPWS